MKHGGSLRPVQSGQLQEVSAPTRTEDRYRGRILANVVNDKGAPQRVLDVLRSDSVVVRRADNQRAQCITKLGGDRRATLFAINRR
jgi:hypothetical protein